jgi:hypothetical protein
MVQSVNGIPWRIALYQGRSIKPSRPFLPQVEGYVAGIVITM